MSEITSIFINTLIEMVCIGALVFMWYYVVCKYDIDEIMDKIDNLEYKQDILYQSMYKMRNIINIDDELQDEKSKQIQKIMDEIKSIKKMLG